ncbi:MAG TPA: PadR family transcriptional regulator [Nitrososphaerales archaeon]|nr:PadR family transcriptional regulator [Nitrososphaerales archaeon]
MSNNRSEVFAPKGLLKMLILKIASTKPVTGVEIMHDVPEMTENLWSPSPGSVYYLLGEMEENGLIIRVPTGEPGIKRYVSSEKGKLSLDTFKLEVKKNLHRQLVMLRVLSDLAENSTVSDSISSVARKIASR